MKEITLADCMAINKAVRNLPEGISNGFRQHNVCVGYGTSEALSYVSYVDIEKKLDRALRIFSNLISQVETKHELALALAVFWETFVLLIHPFVDGNGRTAKEISQRIADSFGFDIENFYLIERCATKDPLKRNFYLQVVFLMNLKEKEK